jgi:hypothetical protein
MERENMAALTDLALKLERIASKLDKCQKQDACKLRETIDNQCLNQLNYNVLEERGQHLTELETKEGQH